MKTLEYRDGSLWLIDQTRLPIEAKTVECADYTQVAEAIRSLRVRGAPAIGLAAAYGLVLAAHAFESWAETSEQFERELERVSQELVATRPTAVNLHWALQRLKRTRIRLVGYPPREISRALLGEADRMVQEDEDINRQMGRVGAGLIPDGANILTHCNTGALAAGAFGTALGAIVTAHRQGKGIHVWVDETRPLLQGARLTSWELQQEGVPFTLITDSMAGHFMQQGKVDMAMVGADRIVANGDAANKIGTYSAAVLAHHHGIPFYFVAPISTIDMSTESGERIVIEERQADEVTSIGGRRVAPENVRAANPAFDVTPACLTTGIVTEKGVVSPPYVEGLERLMNSVDPLIFLGKLAALSEPGDGSLHDPPAG